MSNFLGKGKVFLNDTNYLVDAKGNPITNKEFVVEQQEAHSIVCLSTKAPKTTKVVEETVECTSVTRKEFVKVPEVNVGALNKQLREESIAFVNSQWEAQVAKRVNDIMNSSFNSLKQFEDFGMFFDEGVVQLEKIYTVQEVVDALVVCVREGLVK